MGEQYRMILENGTDQPWYFGVYQKSLGLTNVAWQVRGIPPQDGSVPSSAQVTWTLDYGLCIASFDEVEQKYTGEQFAPANLGNMYKVVSLDGIPSIDTKPIATVSPDQIALKNNTANALTIGFTVGNTNIIAVEDSVGGEQETIYQVRPTYFVACYRNIVLGQLVDEGVPVIGPVEVAFECGAKSIKVVASKDEGGNYRMSVVPIVNGSS